VSHSSNSNSNIDPAQSVPQLQHSSSSNANSNVEIPPAQSVPQLQHSSSSNANSNVETPPAQSVSAVINAASPSVATINTSSSTIAGSMLLEFQNEFQNEFDNIDHRNYFLKKVIECRHFPAYVLLAFIPAFKKVIIELIANLKHDQHSLKSSQSIKAFLTLPGFYVAKMNKASYIAKKAYDTIAIAQGEVSDLILDLYEENQSNRTRKSASPAQAIPSVDIIPDYISKKILANVKANQASDAIKCLESIAKSEAPVFISPSSEHFPAAEKLHVKADFQNHVMPQIAPQITVKPILVSDLLKHCSKIKKQKSPGFSAWTSESVVEVFKYDMETMSLVTELMNLLVMGKGGDTNIWLASRLVLIKKASGGIRPIAIQDAWIRFLLSYLAGTVKEKAASHFAPHQLGIGTSGGAEIMIHSMNAIVEKILATPETSDEVIIKLDFKNAFNSMYRRPIYDHLLEKFPDLAPWFHYAYSKSTPIFSSDSQYLFNSEVGVKQGDPLGSFFFACGAQKSVQDIIAKFPIGLDILGYLDDNNLIVKRSMAKDVYKHLVLNFKKIGLEINPDKTFIFGSPASLQFLKDERNSSLSQIPNKNMSSELISVLGVPLGTDSQVKLELKKSITNFSRIIPLITQLNAKLAFFLLKFCINTRITYILRTSGPWVSKESVRLFDSYIDKAIQNLSSSDVIRIIKNLEDLDSVPDLSDISKIVRSLPIREGGAGTRRGFDIHEVAYTASFLKSFQFICCEPKMKHFVDSLNSIATPFKNNNLVALIQPLDLKYKSTEVNNMETLSLYLHDKSSKTPNQKILTEQIDKRLVTTLKESLVEKELLTSLAWFVSNKPTETAYWLLYPFQDQSLIELTPSEFVELLRLRLLMPIDTFDANHCRQCACDKVLFPGKDDHHFMVCQAVGGPCSDRTKRHNEIRSAWFRLVRCFYPYGVVAEEQFIEDPLVEGGTRRKSDVALFGAGDANSIHYDISVSCPATLSACQLLKTHEKPFAAAIAREQNKSTAYKNSFGEVFVANQLVPVVLEAPGTFGPSLQSLMKKFKKMAKQAATNKEQQRLGYQIKWFYKLSVIICCKYTAKLASFHRAHRRPLVAIGNHVFAHEPFPADPFNDTTYAPIFQLPTPTPINVQG